MKRQQVRYNTEHGILRDIDRLQARAKRYLEKASACDEKAKIKFLTSHELQQRANKAEAPTVREELLKECWALRESGKEFKKQAERASVMRNRIVNTQLPRLKNALAEFKTMLLPITDDPGVVLK